MSTAKKTPVAKCDVCGHKDGRRGFVLLTCQECKLNVHRECYGAETFEQSLDFTCWACKSMGTSFQVDGPYKNGKRMEIVQEKRPTRCDFCSVQDGIHAMHPLYDNGGNKGRQLFRCDPDPRLIWVHSLCAFFIGTQGLTYGCARDGTYDGDYSDESDDDDRSVNPELQDVSRDEGELCGGSSPVHHFVYYLRRKEGEEHTRWTKAVEEQKTQLKCTICGSNDKPEKIFRIPLECNANDNEEPEKFQVRHDSSTLCQQATHVGCARWGAMNRNQVQRVYYFPGDPNREAVQRIYCTYHAEDVDAKYQKRKQQQAQADQEAKKATSNTKPDLLAVALSRQIDQRISPSIKKSVARRSLSITKTTSTIMRPSPTSTNSIKRIAAPDLSVLPSLQRKAPMKKSRARYKALAALKPPPGATATDKAKPVKQRKKQWYENLDKDIATPVSQGERPTLVKKRKLLALNHMSRVNTSDLDRIKSDLEEKVTHITDKDHQSRVIKERKKFWKRALSELGTEDFQSMWDDAKNHAVEVIHALQGKKTTKPAAPQAGSSGPPRRDSLTQRAKASKAPPTRRPSASMALTVDLTADDGDDDDDGDLEEQLPKKKAPEARPVEEAAREKESGTEHGDQSPEAERTSQDAEPDDGGSQPLDDDYEEEEEVAPEILSRWSYLSLGRGYRNEQYKFGEWDVFEMV